MMQGKARDEGDPLWPWIYVERGRRGVGLRRRQRLRAWHFEESSAASGARSNASGNGSRVKDGSRFPFRRTSGKHISMLKAGSSTLRQEPERPTPPGWDRSWSGCVIIPPLPYQLAALPPPHFECCGSLPSALSRWTPKPHCERRLKTWAFRGRSSLAPAIPNPRSGPVRANDSRPHWSPLPRVSRYC